MMGDLCLRAIETNEKFDKLVNDGFAPAVIHDNDLKLDFHAKIEMKKIKRLLRRNIQNQNIIIKLKNKTRNCIISNLEKNEITGNVSLVEFNSIDFDDTIITKVPIVYNLINDNKKKSLHVLHSEIEISCSKNNIPEFITINIDKNVMKISDLNIGKDYKILQDNDTLLAELI